MIIRIIQYKFKENKKARVKIRSGEKKRGGDNLSRPFSSDENMMSPNVRNLPECLNH